MRYWYNISHDGKHGGRVDAVDIAPDLIKYAKKHSAHENIKYFNTDITEFRKNLHMGVKYDFIILMDCFEHVFPDKIYKLRDDVLADHSHKDTIIFLNIPSAQHTIYLKENKPLWLQIIDEAYPIHWITNYFDKICYAPVEIDIYSIDGAFPQYNSFVFKACEHINESLFMYYH